MNALYQQQYANGNGPYYVPQGPRATQYARGPKQPMYLMGSEYPGYGYANYVMYPSMAGPYMAATGVASYPTLDYSAVPRQFEGMKEVSSPKQKSDYVSSTTS